MKRLSFFILLTLMLLGISSIRLRAEEKLPAKLQQLTDEAYHSNVSMYFATFALGTIREQSGSMGL